MLAAPERETAGFYVTGGTLSAEATSYVHRSADELLFNGLTSGKFCYVLNSRQMGKSSICVRTMRRLEATGVWTAFVDLTKIGGKNVTPEQWYAGVAIDIGRSLELRSEVVAYWKENLQVGPMQRFFGVLREVVLVRCTANVAIFFDEIDATRSLSFSADEFFAGIRECYNRRVQDPAFSRLTFCLLGVAVPSDLIANPTSTPFNIGERIYLKDFTPEEALPLAEGLKGNAKALLDRVFYWTNGHPYLTQTLCAAIAADPDIKSLKDVDSLVRRELFDPKSRETNINLADVANRALHAGDLEEQPLQFRADLLSAYESVLKGKVLPDDESNRVAALLKLSGLMRADHNKLQIRNRIYKHVFGKEWIRENMPGQETRRQRIAFYGGVLRTACIGAVVIAMVSWLAWNSTRLFKEAEIARGRAEYESYVAKVNFMRMADHDNDNMTLARLLTDTAASPFRNLEWWYWYGRLHDSDKELALPRGIGSVTLAPNGKSLLIQDSEQGYALYSYPGLESIARKAEKALPFGEAPGESIVWLGGHWKSFTRSLDGKVAIKNYPAGDGPQAMTLPNSNVSLFISNNGDFFAAEYHNRAWVWNAHTLHLKGTAELPGRSAYSPTLSNDGMLIAFDEVQGTVRTGRSAVVVDVTTGREVDRFRYVRAGSWKLALSNDGKYLALPTVAGRLYVRDIREHRMIFDRQVSDASLTRSAFSGSGQKLMTVGSDLTARVWDVPSGRQIMSEKGAIDGSIAPNGKSVVVAGEGTRVYQVAESSGADYHPMKGLALATGISKGEVVVTGGSSVRLLNGETLQKDSESSIPVGPRGAYATDDGLYSFALDSGRGATMFEVESGHRICHIRHCDPLWSPTVDRFQRRIYTMDDSDTVAYCYDFDGRQIWSHAVTTLAFGPMRVSPEGRFATVSFVDGRTLLLFARTGLEGGLLAGPQAEARCVAFSAKGRYLAVGNADHQAYIYDLVNPKLPVVCYGHSGYVRWVAFSQDGQRLLTASQDGTVRLWNTRTGEEVLQLGDHGPDLRTAIFNQDATRIYTSTQAPDGGIRVYAIPVGKVVKAVN